MQSLCIMIMIYALHYSFLATGKHLHCFRRWVHVATQMQRRKMLTAPKSLFNLTTFLVNKIGKAEDNKQIPGFIYNFVNFLSERPVLQTSLSKYTSSVQY